MTLAELSSFVLVLAAAAAVPGPDIAAIVGRALGVGFVRTLPLIAGIVAGHALWMLAACLGLAALALALGPAFVVIKIAAVAYLLYLAWQLWRAPVAEESGSGTVATSRTPTGGGLAAGLLVSLSNPKAIVLFGAVLPGVLPVERLSGIETLGLLLTSSLTLVVVFFAWAAAAARARAALVTAARRRALNRASAVVLAGTGVAVAVR